MKPYVYSPPRDSTPADGQPERGGADRGVHRDEQSQYDFQKAHISLPLTQHRHVTPARRRDCGSFGAISRNPSAFGRGTLHTARSIGAIVKSSSRRGLTVKRNSNRNAAPLRALSLACALAGAMALAGCGGGDDPTDAQRLDAAALTTDQRAVAEALIAGFQRETGADTVSAAEVDQAICYARTVEMPAAFADAHRRYLADYAAIDQDFYPWFEANAVSAQDAWAIAERVQQGFAACPQGEA